MFDGIRRKWGLGKWCGFEFEFKFDFSGSGSDGEDYGIEKPGWGRNQGRPVLTTLSLSLLFLFLLLFASIYLLFNMGLG